MGKLDASLKKQRLQEIVANLESTLENQKMTSKTRNALTKMYNQRKRELDELR